MADRPDIMKDYVPVNERIAAFYEKHPEGSIQSDIVELSETRVVMRAWAYRSPTDERPGQGHSSLEIPGRTPYTRGSEVENCETSAWGRAIAALGFEVKRGIASAEEVRNKAGADQPKADEQAALRPQSKGEAEAFLGVLTKSGVIRKGGSERYKLEVHETPEGPTFGFRLELAETEQDGGHKAIPQVLVPPALAVPLLADIGRDPAVLEKQTVRVKGQLFQVSQPGRQSYYRLLVKEWKDEERTIPSTEALPDAGLFEDAGPEPPDDVALVGEKA